MARIVGVDLPVKKRAFIGLTYIFGIGRVRAEKILAEAKVDRMKKIEELTEDEVTRIRSIITEAGRVEGDLRKEVQLSIKRLVDIGAYRGSRHMKRLPVRGQRTHTNARTRKGPRGLAIKKKELAAK
jgi:small subunit ribosomal protein S13